MMTLAMDFQTAMLRVTKVHVIKRLKYPDPDYEGQLLVRLLKKGRISQYGNDTHAMSRDSSKKARIFDSRTVCLDSFVAMMVGYPMYSS